MTPEFLNGCGIAMYSIFLFGLSSSYLTRMGRRTDVSIRHMRIAYNDILDEIAILRGDIRKMTEEFATLQAETEALRGGCGCGDDKSVSDTESVSSHGSMPNLVSDTESVSSHGSMPDLDPDTYAAHNSNGTNMELNSTSYSMSGLTRASLDMMNHQPGNSYI
jgi:hypothetical protein